MSLNDGVLVRTPEQNTLLSQTRAASQQVLQAASVVAARAAAEGASGLVITDAAAAAAVVDRKKAIRSGEQAIADWKRRLAEFPNAVLKEIREALRSDESRLDAARSCLAMAETRWLTSERDRVAREQREAREAEARAREQAAAAAAAVGAEDDTPESTATVAPAPRVVRGGSGVSVLVERKEIALVDAAAYAAVDPCGLMLTPEAKAKILAGYRAPTWQRPEGAIELPDGAGFMFNGVRYYTVAGSSTR